MIAIPMTAEAPQDIVPCATHSAASPPPVGTRAHSATYRGKAHPPEAALKGKA